MARTKATAKTRRHGDEVLIVVKVPKRMAEQLDDLAERQDSDRSKETRHALRERIRRFMPDAYQTAAHA